MKKGEEVLVVRSRLIFKGGKWQGLKTENLGYYLDLIRNNFQFKPRAKVEKDSSWQQIVCYIIFNFQDKYFLYRYLKKAGEKRLRQDYILGIGGHINPIDLKPGKDILDEAVRREWQEEIVYKGKLLEKKIIGVLNDERREVEAVHLGLVYLFRGDSPDIFVREKDILKGELVKLKDLAKYVTNTGGWAPIVYKEYLSKLL